MPAIAVVIVVVVVVVVIVVIVVVIVIIVIVVFAAVIVAIVVVVVVIVVVANPPCGAITIANAIAIAAPGQRIVRSTMATAHLFQGGGHQPWSISRANFMAVARVLSFFGWAGCYLLCMRARA